MNNKDFVEYLKQRLFIEFKKQTASMFDTGSARKIHQLLNMYTSKERIELKDVADGIRHVWKK